MVPYYGLLFLVLAYSPAISTLGHGTADPSFLEPRIFYNLTLGEFHALKRHRISKRDPVRLESRNNADQQLVIEQRVIECHHLGHLFRPDHGFCTGGDTIMFWFCDHIDNHRAHQPSKQKECQGTDEKPERCVTMEVYNFKGELVPMPYCADVLEIDEPEEDADRVRAFSGEVTLPDGAWSPGHYDTFWQLFGEYKDLSGHFTYDGHYESGDEFKAQSPKHVSSWCCLDCPSGTLKVQTLGFKSMAVGITVPAGSWF